MFFITPFPSTFRISFCDTACYDSVIWHASVLHDIGLWVYHWYYQQQSLTGPQEPAWYRTSVCHEQRMSNDLLQCDFNDLLSYLQQFPMHLTRTTIILHTLGNQVKTKNCVNQNKRFWNPGSSTQGFRVDWVIDKVIPSHKSPFLHWHYPYLIFVIFFTRAKFLEN